MMVHPVFKYSIIFGTVEGSWGNWGQYGTCSGTCDSTATHNRTRNYSGGTKPCTGNDTELAVGCQGKNENPMKEYLLSVKLY